MQADLAGREIHVLVVVELQIDGSILPEALNWNTRLRVQRDHLVAGGDVDDPFLPAVGPIRQASPRQLPRGRFAALSFVEVVQPEHLARLGVEGDGRTTAPCSQVQYAL